MGWTHSPPRARQEGPLARAADDIMLVEGARGGINLKRLLSRRCQLHLWIGLVVESTDLGGGRVGSGRSVCDLSMGGGSCVGGPRSIDGRTGVLLAAACPRSDRSTWELLGHLSIVYIFASEVYVGMTDSRLLIEKN